MNPKEKTDGARWEDEITDLYGGPGEEEPHEEEGDQDPEEEGDEDEDEE